MDGMEVCRRIKSDENFKDLPLLFITSGKDTKNTAQGLNLGAEDVIAKPFNKMELIARIRLIMNSQKLLNELKHEASRRERVEKELQAINNDLEIKIRERTAELEEINKHLKVEVQECRQAEKARLIG